MTATTIDRTAPARGGPHRPGADPVPPADDGRAGQDVRHPRRLLADHVHRRARAFIATASVILFAPDSAMTYDNFGAAIGVPMTLLLPVMAILSVTSEWSQRSGLTTFTLVPHRGRVIWAKMIVSMALGAVSIGVALAIGALGNIVGTAIAGVDTVWDISGNQIVLLVFANVLNLLIGFMLGVLIRNSPGAIVGFVVYSFVLPTLSMVLGNFQQWWEDIRPWLDFNWAQGELYDGHLTGDRSGRSSGPPA